MKTMSNQQQFFAQIAALAILSAFAACQGPAGPAGLAGESCTVHKEGGISTILCPDGSSTSVLDGPPGASPVADIVDPCPTLPATHPEVLFLIEGVYYAVYASGKHIHLTPLAEGITYLTTDGRACYFKIIDGEVVAL